MYSYDDEPYLGFLSLAVNPLSDEGKDLFVGMGNYWDFGTNIPSNPEIGWLFELEYSNGSWGEPITILEGESLGGPTSQTVYSIIDIEVIEDPFNANKYLLYAGTARYNTSGSAVASMSEGKIHKRYWDSGTSSYTNSVLPDIPTDDVDWLNNPAVLDLKIVKDFGGPSGYELILVALVSGLVDDADYVAQTHVYAWIEDTENWMYLDSYNLGGGTSDFITRSGYTLEVYGTSQGTDIYVPSKNSRIFKAHFHRESITLVLTCIRRYNYVYCSL